MLRTTTLIITLAITAAHAADRTTVTFTDEVAMKNMPRIGMNISGDAYYKPPALKRRLGLNFEEPDHTIFVLWQKQFDENKPHIIPFQRLRNLNDRVREAMVKNGKLMLLQEPDIFRTFKIKDIVMKSKQGGEIVLAEPIPVTAHMKGAPHCVLLAPSESTEEPEGKRPGWGALIHNNKEEGFRFAVGDVPPGSWGDRAFRVDASAAARENAWALSNPDEMDGTGKWKAELWLKADAGTPAVAFNIRDARWEITPTAQWKKYEHTFDVPEVKPDSGWISLDFEVKGGAVLMDDIVVEKLGFENPTPFTDDFVKMLKDDIRIGVFRQLLMGGRFDGYLNTVNRNHLRRGWWTVTEYYTLCEYIDAEPWHSVPGLMTPEDMRNMIEYLAAPADHGFGKLRAEQGHPKPWTDVFNHIYLQVANEPITFSGNSPHADYWRAVAEAAHASPYWNDRIVLTASSQDVRAGGGWYDWKSYTMNQPRPDIDAVAEGGYFLQGLWEEDFARYDNERDQYQWLAGLVEHTWDVDRKKFSELVTGAGYKLVIYETSFHTTFGSASSQKRNSIVASVGGAVSQIHNLLYPVKDHQVLAQCFFTLFQDAFSPGGSFGDNFPGKTVKLWGTVLNNRKGHERYRPAALGLRVINEVIGGDLVHTRQTGARPTVACVGRYDDSRGRKNPKGMRLIPTEEIATNVIDAVSSYAFVEGDRRGLILLNVDAHRPHDVTIEFDGNARGNIATQWMLHEDDLRAHNENLDAAPQVTIKESGIEKFKSGYEMTLPPFSITALEWHVR